ncbi:MAG TPA: preprotein translocase subunit SecG [Candidatus Jorgensenbacteria bacterium]|nr:preprotein translocase subunit SecG [Candidatus Jorgensenbacteria bacterium]
MIVTLQVIVSIILIVLILIQERSSGLSSVLGGSSGTPYQSRRGLEKMILWGTVVAVILFIVLAVVNLLF